MVNLECKFKKKFRTSTWNLVAVHSERRLTVWPSGTWPLITDRMSCRWIPVVWLSPKPMTSHRRNPSGSSSSVKLWILKDCNWHGRGNHTRSPLGFLSSHTSWCNSGTFLVQPMEEQPTMARLVTLPLNTDWTELIKLDFPEPTGPRKRTRAWRTSAHLGANLVMSSNRLSFHLEQGNGEVCGIFFLSFSFFNRMFQQHDKWTYFNIWCTVFK